MSPLTKSSKSRQVLRLGGKEARKANVLAGSTALRGARKKNCSIRRSSAVYTQSARVR